MIAEAGAPRPSPEAIAAGTPFRYDVVGHGTAEQALREAQAWQAQQASGPGSLLYGRTVPVAWGEPYRKPWQGAYDTRWYVPVMWAVEGSQAARHAAIRAMPASPAKYFAMVREGLA